MIWIYPLGTLTGYYTLDDSFVEIEGGTVDGGGNLRGRSLVGFPSILFVFMAGKPPGAARLTISNLAILDPSALCTIVL